MSVGCGCAIKEGLEPRSGALGENRPPDLLQIQEGLAASLWTLAMATRQASTWTRRDNRQALADYAHERTVLNCFAYSGGFGIWALRGGARM